MKSSRRNFLGASGLLLVVKFLEMLATPLGKWTEAPRLLAATAPNPECLSPVTYVDVAREAGLNVPNVLGGVEHKKYIIEAKGSGIAFFDYDQDGWLDIYLTNGSRLDTTRPQGQEPLMHVLKNCRHGTFADLC